MGTAATGWGCLQITNDLTNYRKSGRTKPVLTAKGMTEYPPAGKGYISPRRRKPGAAGRDDPAAYTDWRKSRAARNPRRSPSTVPL
jgi:hypothetical protein